MKITAFATGMLVAGSQAITINDDILELIRLFDSAVLITYWRSTWEMAYSFGKVFVCGSYSLSNWPDTVGALLGGFTASDVTADFDAAGVTA